MDLISREEAIKQIKLCENHDMEHDFEFNEGLIVAMNAVEELPTAEPEIIRCRECKWWDKKRDSSYGYCHAAKHGYWSKNWEINIYRTYKEDF